MGRGRKCACGMVNSPGGEESILPLLLLLLLLALPFKAIVTGTPQGLKIQPASYLAGRNSWIVNE